MAAHGDATVTIDTNEWVYTDKDGMTKHTVSNAETFVLDLTAASTGEYYKMLDGKTLSCTDGTKLTIEADPQFTWFRVPADATKKLQAGAMRIRENDGQVSDFELDVTIDDVDEPTALTVLATDKNNTKRKFTLTTVTVAQ